jgi:hypothetical protein
MPNWCDNIVSITGPTEKLQLLYQDIHKEDSGLLNALVPQPENVFRGSLGQKEREMCEENGIPNWYDWNRSNWGTKWDVNHRDLHVEITDHDDGTSNIECSFFTAWGPPETAFETYCSKNLDVGCELSYFEPGMGFAGSAVFQHGHVEIGDFAVGSVSDLEHVPLRLVEQFNMREVYEAWEECEDEEEAA